MDTAGWHCEISCNGTSACRDSILNCNANYDCSVDFDGTSSCRKSDINCGNGLCNVDCDGTNACEDNTTLHCGARNGTLD